MGGRSEGKGRPGSGKVGALGANPPGEPGGGVLPEVAAKVDEAADLTLALFGTLGAFTEVLTATGATLEANLEELLLISVREL